MSLNLNDPRQYSAAYPDSNILINQAIHDLANNDNNSLMIALVEDFLKQQQDGLISVAYNLAPTSATADYIWQALQQALNSTNASCEFFAVPLVIVSGSSSEVSLPNAVDQTKLHELLLAKQILTSAATAYISGQLYDLAALSQFKPSHLFQLQHSSTSLTDFDWSGLSAAPIINHGEKVHLRFLCGVAQLTQDQPAALIKANFANLGLELMQLLTTSLASSDTTICVLPFAPCRLSEAVVVGQQAWNEIGLTLRLSNLVKKMRLERREPKLVVAAKDSQIQIQLKQQGSDAQLELLSWPLERADNFVLVTQVLSNLFADMQLEVSYEQNQG